MSSIYISIPTLEDPEYMKTIHSLIDNCSPDNEVFIGSAVTTSQEWFKDAVAQLSGYNIKFIKLDPETEAGVGFGRYYSMSLYSGQDYAMQLDAHTKVEPNWDKTIIDIYNKSLQYTNNDKVILTAYLGLYEYETNGEYDPDGEQTVLDSKPMFASFAPGNKNGKGSIPNWEVLPNLDIPKPYADEPFIPSNMFCGQFAFSDGRFAQNSGVVKEAMFLDEELMQTANLLNMGYSLVYPNTDLPFTHLYFWPGQANKRKTLHDIVKDSRIDNDIHNYARFMSASENKSKVERFKNYIGFNPLGTTDKILQIPGDFNRL
jgi:hypothetical protein